MDLKQALALCGGAALVVFSGLTTVIADDSPDASINVVASTIPSNGDVNPYGVAVVPVSMGKLQQGHILVSNFNNSMNMQGTGTTIVDVAPDGTVNLFAQIDPTALPGPCPGGVGLTTALGVVRAGWVFVGSLPTADGTAATAQAGCILVLNSRGKVMETISGPLINGPWDMTVLDAGGTALLFVTNVLNGTVAASPNVVSQGTVVRIGVNFTRAVIPGVDSMTVIGTGFPERTDPDALVIGPTGLGLAPNGTLYVADSLDNRIAAIPNAVLRQTALKTGITVSEGGALSDPLGLTIGPAGNIVVVNGNNGLLVIVRPQDGAQIFKGFLDTTGTPPGAGTLFGLAFASEGLYFVDDGSNTLNLVSP
ncbi:MAG TPA: hypothetical protein VLX58_10605 [Bryobacteraceae bacterium]|nr:hypothetical protein [Bryobacteraceae bacterium]